MGERKVAANNHMDMLLAAASAVAATTGVEPSALAEDWLTDGDDDSDSPESDMSAGVLTRLCQVCKLREAPGLLPLCIPCHTQKKTHYPPRPKHKKGTSSQSKVVTSSDLRSLLSNLKQTEPVPTTSRESHALDSMSWDKVQVPKGSLSSQDTTITNNTSSSKEVEKSLCIMCNDKTPNSIFLHATNAHMCCCYTCAVKYWCKARRCAYCNRKAKNVLRVFSV